MSLHETAILDPGACVGADVEVGPYAVLGDGVTVGDRCRIGPHACLQGPLELGEECVVGPGAALGGDPQIKGKSGPFGAVRIGKRCIFREFSQVHRSMLPDGATVVGDDGYFMATAHVGHDCVVGNDVVVCNGALLAGHVEVQDNAFVSGGVVIHQFVRIGELAMTGGNSAIHLDLPPFCMAVGERPKSLGGLNLVGLRRAGLGPEVRRALQAAYRTLFRSDLTLAQRLEAVDRDVAEVARLASFIEASQRGVIGFRG
ncbi:MAG: acyl-ACP--UDP-N-acetylglucosamine O-acyltransferase [Planctomycetota bacterium]|jgi:UDP-N-acetylglucosamine acyltransferase